MRMQPSVVIAKQNLNIITARLQRKYILKDDMEDSLNKARVDMRPI